MPIRKPSKVAKQAGKAINTRRLHGIRYDSSTGKERDFDQIELADELKKEFLAAIAKAQVPLEVAHMATEFILDELTDRLVLESLSWSESMTPYRASTRKSR